VLAEDLPLMESLLEEYPEYLNIKDDLGTSRSALMDAAVNGKDQAVEWLIEKVRTPHPAPRPKYFVWGAVYNACCWPTCKAKTANSILRKSALAVWADLALAPPPTPPERART
jgi:hypothetical protein